MKVTNEITPYKINGIDRKVGDENFLIVQNVWNCSQVVEIKFGKQSIEVHKKDLLKAIDNATNNERL
jgi:hypothetical protein